MMKDTETIKEAFLQASSYLHSCQLDQDPKRCTEWMLMHLLSWSRTDLYLRWDEPFPPELEVKWQHMLERKAAGEPVQYIIGEQEFMGLPLKTEKGVLIPRPETELLVEYVLKHSERLERDGDRITAVDVGTGTGAIPIALAAARPQWRFLAVDISEKALLVAQKNARIHGVEEQMECVLGNLLEPLLEREQDIDLLVSNPPYIPSKEVEQLQRGVRDFEPRLALDGGADGFTFYHKMARQIKKLPSLPKLVAWEVGAGQARQVEAILRDCGFAETDIVQDLAGSERHVVAWNVMDKV